MITFEKDDWTIEPLEANSDLETRTIKALARSAWVSRDKADSVGSAIQRKTIFDSTADLEKDRALVRCLDKSARDDLHELAPLLTRCGYETGTKVDCGGVVILYLVSERIGPYCMVRGKTLPDFPVEGLDSLDAGLDGNSDRDEYRERVAEFSEMIKVG